MDRTTVIAIAIIGGSIMAAVAAAVATFCIRRRRMKKLFDIPKGLSEQIDRFEERADVVIIDQTILNQTQNIDIHTIEEEPSEPALDIVEERHSTGLTRFQLLNDEDILSLSRMSPSVQDRVLTSIGRIGKRISNALTSIRDSSARSSAASSSHIGISKSAQGSARSSVSSIIANVFGQSIRNSITSCAANSADAPINSSIPFASGGVATGDASIIMRTSTTRTSSSANNISSTATGIISTDSISTDSISMDATSSVAPRFFFEDMHEYSTLETLDETESPQTEPATPRAITLIRVRRLSLPSIQPEEDVALQAMPVPSVNLEHNLRHSYPWMSQSSHTTPSRSATTQAVNPPTPQPSTRLSAGVHVPQLARTQSIVDHGIALDDRNSTTMPLDATPQNISPSHRTTPKSLGERSSAELEDGSTRPRVAKLDLATNVVQDMQNLSRTRQRPSPASLSVADQTSSDPYRYHAGSNTYQPMPPNMSSTGSFSGVKQLSAREQVRIYGRPRLLYPREAQPLNFTDSGRLQAVDPSTQDLRLQASLPSFVEDRGIEGSPTLLTSPRTSRDSVHNSRCNAMQAAAAQPAPTLVPLSSLDETGIEDVSKLFETPNVHALDLAQSAILPVQDLSEEPVLEVIPSSYSVVKMSIKDSSPLFHTRRGHSTAKPAAAASGRSTLFAVDVTLEEQHSTSHTPTHNTQPKETWSKARILHPHKFR